MSGRSWTALAIALWMAPIACPPARAADPVPVEPAALAVKERSARISRMVAGEEWILGMAPHLSGLSTSALNLRLPDHHSWSLFSAKVEVADVVQGSRAAGTVPAVFTPPAAGGVSERAWSVAPTPTQRGRGALDLWRPLLDELAYFEHARFFFIEGSHTPERRRSFDAKLGFTGLARLRDGGWISIRAEIDTRWRKPGGFERLAGGVLPWQIARWEVKSLRTQRADRRWFRDAGGQALPDPRLRARAEGSIHEDHLVAMAREGQAFRAPHPYFLVRPTDWQPGLSVIDIDRDGFDDLYAMDRWGANVLLHNQGDGTFVDIAPAVGLDIEDHSSAAIFADFDNDGDADVFVGRTLTRSRYLSNEDGRFVDRSEQWLGARLPSLVTSISAADYNGDGLLDVYFSTYAAELMAVQLAENREGADVPFLEQFLPKGQARRLAQLYRRSQKYLGRAGPPNVLLVNRGGGRFALAPESVQLEGWRNSFQATWADFDLDGDPDLYVANDFSPNHLYRNDGGRFVDVTAASTTADIGFGMGASFGDYDDDGLPDLYVSNMYSKAGRRITAQVPGLDPRLQGMARGNSLFRNRGEGRFEKVSGLEPPSLQVERAGWSWGGQFVDVDNDGRLDLYAASGMYTAPAEFAIAGADL